jgi:hypothetical protein
MTTLAPLSLDNACAWMPHAPHPKQRLFLRLSCMEALYGGSAGGGKSDALLMSALQGVEIPGYSSILFRRTFRDLSLADSLMDRSHQWWDNTAAHWDGLNNRWTFPTGARIGFGYLDGPNDHSRYQSAQFQHIGFDELTHFEERGPIYLLSRLRRPTGFPDWLPLRHRSGTNPGGIGHTWVKARYAIPDSHATSPILQRRNGVIERAFIPALLSDNPGIDTAEYSATLGLLDPVSQRQLRDGEWIQDASGLVYYCYGDHCVIDCLPPSIPQSEWLYGLSMDYGATRDATAFAIHAWSPYEPEVYLIWTEEHHRMSPSDAAKRTMELDEQYHVEFMVGDAGGLGAGYLLEAQKHFAIPIVPAEKQMKAGYIKLLNGEMNRGRYKVLARACETFDKQARHLLWANDKHEKENESQENHSTDCALYGWRAARHYDIDKRPPHSPVAKDEIEQEMDRLDQEREFEESTYRTGTDDWD